MRRPKSKSDPTERYGRTKLVVIAAFLILAPSVVLASATAAEGFVTFYAVVALFIVLLPFLLRRRYDLFEPINFVVLNVLIGITLRTIYIAFFAQTQSRWFLMQGRSLAFLQSKFPLILLGLLALTIGYLREGVRVPIEKWVPNISADRWYTNRLAVLLIVLSFVAGVSLFIYMRTMNVPMTLNLFQISSHRHYEVRGASEWAYGGMGYYLWGIQLFKIAFYLQLAYVLRTKKGLFSPAGITALLLGIGALALPIMNNSRQGMSMVFIHAGILFHYLRRSIRLRWLLAVATALSVVFIFLTSLRRGARSTHEVMQFYQPAPILRHMVGNRNLLGAAKTAHIIDGVPEHLPYQYGRSYVVWLVTPVPRTVWPDKPAIRTGALVGEAIFNTPERTGVPPGVIGELYINFGLVGIPIGMFLVGFGLRSLYVTLRPHLKSRNGALVYLCFLTPLGYQLVASDFPGTMINLGKNIIPILAATYLLTDSRTG